VLSVRALACQRGERVLFEGLNLALLPGSVTWLRGRNGRGKTSLLRLLAGLSAPESGEIHIAGREAIAAGASWRRHWAYVAHQNALKDDLSATEALWFLARLHGLPCGTTELQQALRRMGMASRQHAPVRTLSQGQRRRVALARLALSKDAALWLLDEPFDALDIDGITALNSLIAEHAQRGGCVLLTSHQPLTLQSPAPAVLDLEAFAPTKALPRSSAQAST
jgi:heme exporter protein A